MALSFIPNRGNSLLVTRDAIKDNFVDLDRGFSVNHFDYNNANEGKHMWVSLPYTTSTTPNPLGAPGTAANELALFSNGGNLYIQTANQTTGGCYPINTAFESGNGWAKLPSGVTLQWGQGQTDGTNMSVQVFPIPFVNPPYSVQVTLYQGSSYNTIGSAVVTNSNVNNEFYLKTYNSAGLYAGFYSWFAIGV